MAVDVSWLRREANECRLQADGFDRIGAGFWAWIFRCRSDARDAAQRYREYAENWDRVADEIESAASREGAVGSSETGELAD